MRVCLVSQDCKDPRETKEALDIQVRFQSELLHSPYLSTTLGIVIRHVGIPCEFLLWCVCVCACVCCTGQAGRPGEKGTPGLPGSAGEPGLDGRPGK